MIKRVEIEQVLPIRNVVLRNNRGLEASRFDGDENPGSFHLGYFSEEKLVSIVTFLPKDHQEGGTNGYQLRGMATLPGFTGKGYGTALVNFAVDHFKNSNIPYIWCNARVSAAGFYERMDFKIISEAFFVENIGPHYQMLRFLNTAPDN